MKKKLPAEFCLAALCLLLLLSPASAETRQGVIALEGMEEPIEETLFESPQGFSFWYASDRLEADSWAADNAEGAVVVNPYSDDRMTLSIITEEEAARLARASRADMPDPSDESRAQTELYRKPEGGMISFCALIAENGRFLRAAGEYSLEAAEGTAKFFDRVLDSVSLVSEYDLQMLKELPGK